MVIGAATISVMGACFQARLNQHEREMQRLQAIERNQYEFLVNFCHEFENSISLLKKVISKDIWLKNNKEKVNTPEYVKEEKIREQYYLLYLEQRKPNALFVQAEALFDSKEVHASIDELKDKVKILYGSKNEQEIEKNMSLIDKAFSQSAMAMGIELKQP